MADEPLTEAAKRAYDVIALHYTAIGEQCVGKWVALNLSTGGSDGDLYDNREQAIRHNPDYHCYICIPPTFSPKEIETFLRFSRALFTAGMRVPDMTREHVMPLNMEHIPGGHQ